MKRLLLTLLMALSLRAAITIDNSASGYSTNNSAGGTLSLTLTVASQATMIVVAVGSGCAGVRSSSVVANGTAGFSFAQLGYSSTGNPQAELWYLTSPPTGSVTITITLGGANYWSTWSAGAVSLVGTATSSAMDGSSGKSVAAGASISDSISTSAANDWIVDVMATGLNTCSQTVAPGASQSQWFAAGGCPSVSAFMAWGSYIPNAAQGNVTASWTIAGGSGIRIAHAMMAIKAALGHHKILTVN